MATFYVIRHKANGKMLSLQYFGVGARYTPVVGSLEEVDDLQRLLSFKTKDEAVEFMGRYLRIICNPDWTGAVTKNLEIVPIQVEMVQPKKAYRIHCVTDQGNGGAHCSECGTDLTDTPKLGGNAPNPCPGCGLVWEDTSAEGYSFGGSDF